MASVPDSISKGQRSPDLVCTKQTVASTQYLNIFYYEKNIIVFRFFSLYPH